MRFIYFSFLSSSFFPLICFFISHKYFFHDVQFYVELEYDRINSEFTESF